MSVDIELFIEAVKLRPALYDTKIKHYADKNLKKELWCELCREFVDKWDELGNKEKTQKCNGLQKKWKNLRTCFKREYDAQKNIVPGSRGKKRRKYLYFEQMSFLCDSIENRITSSMEQNDNDDKGDVDEHKESQEPTVDTRSNLTATSSTQRKAPISKSYEESLLHMILKERKVEDTEIDDDKYFLLSLLPSFKKFNEDQKFVARTQIMNVMRHVRMSGGSSTANLNIGDPVPLDAARWTRGNSIPSSYEDD